MTTDKENVGPYRVVWEPNPNDNEICQGYYAIWDGPTELQGTWDEREERHVRRACAEMNFAYRQAVERSTRNPSALEELVEACEHEFAVGLDQGVENDLTVDDNPAYQTLTFGHIRRARAALDEMKGQST